MIHGLAALPGGFNGDGEVLFELRLAGEIGQARGTKSGFKLAFALQRRERCDTGLTHLNAPAPAPCGTWVQRRKKAPRLWLFAPRPRRRNAGSPDSARPTAHLVRSH